MRSLVEPAGDRPWLRFLTGWSLLAAVVILALMLTFAAGVLPHTRTAGFHRSTIEG